MANLQNLLLGRLFFLAASGSCSSWNHPTVGNLVTPYGTTFAGRKHVVKRVPGFVREKSGVGDGPHVVATTKGTQIHPKRRLECVCQYGIAIWAIKNGVWSDEYEAVMYALHDPSPGSDDSQSLLTLSNVKVMVRSKSSAGRRSLAQPPPSTWTRHGSSPHRAFYLLTWKKPQARACNLWRVRGQTRPGTILVAIESIFKEKKSRR